MSLGDIAYWMADEASIRDRCWKPEAGQTVMDVGAHIGSYSLPALQAGARVIAVDPDAGRLSLLRQLAGADAGQLTTCCCALAAPGGLPGEYRAMLAASPWPDMAPGDSAVFTTLDDLAASEQLGALDWVKIDVEGAEFCVLAGAGKSLKRFRPRLLIESHDLVYPWAAKNEIKRQCVTLLGGLGYRVDAILYMGGSSPAREFLVCLP